MSEILPDEFPDEYESFISIQRLVGKLEERTTLLATDVKHEHVNTLKHRLGTSQSMFELLAAQLKRDITYKKYFVAIQVRLNELSFSLLKIRELIDERIDHIERYSPLRKFLLGTAKWITARNRLLTLLQILANAIPIPFVQQGVALMIRSVRELTTESAPKQLPPPKQ